MDPEDSVIVMPRGRAWSETWRLLDAADERAILTGCTATLVFSVKTGSAVEEEATVEVNEETEAEDGAGEVAFSLTEEQVDAFADHRVLHWLFKLTDTLGEVHEARGTVRMEDDL